VVNLVNVDSASVCSTVVVFDSFFFVWEVGFVGLFCYTGVMLYWCEIIMV
jgi:hypothetical protein